MCRLGGGKCVTQSLNREETEELVSCAVTEIDGVPSSFGPGVPRKVRESESKDIHLGRDEGTVYVMGPLVELKDPGAKDQVKGSPIRAI